MLVSQGQEETKVEKSHDNASEIAKTLRHASKNMHMYAHNPVMFPSHRPLPTMVLQDMCVQVFRPSEIAGGMSRNTKSSATNSGMGNNNNNANSSRSNTHNAHSTNATGNKVTKPGFSMSAYLGGSANRSIGYNGHSNNSLSGDKLAIMDDMDSPEWIPTHSRSSNNNNSNVHRMSLSNMLGATSSNKASASLPQPDNTYESHYDHNTGNGGDNDEWGFNPCDSYNALGDNTSSNYSRNYAPQTTGNFNHSVQNHCSTGVHRNSSHASISHSYDQYAQNANNTHNSIHNDSSAIDDDAELYSWGAEAPNATLNTSHYINSNKTIAVVPTSHNSSNNWANRNTTNNNFRKAIEVVDLLDSPVVKSHKKAADLLPAKNTVATSTDTNLAIASATTLPVSASTATAATTSITATTVNKAPSVVTTNPFPRTVFKANLSSSVPSIRNAPFAGVRLTNVVRSTNRNISFVALDDDLSLSSADESTVPAPTKLKMNIHRSMPGPSLPTSSCSTSSRMDQAKSVIVTSTSRAHSNVPIMNSNTENAGRASLCSTNHTKGTIDQDVEGLSDTQSESEGKSDRHVVRKHANTVSGPTTLQLNPSTKVIPDIKIGTTSNCESAPPPPRSQYVDNSGIDWGSSSSGSSGSSNSSGESQERENEHEIQHSEPFTDLYNSSSKQRRKVPRIKETQECFFSQCSISEEEDCGQDSNNISASKSIVPVEPKPFSVRQDSRALPIHVAQTHTSSNKTDTKDDSGDESDGSDASDTANACCACLDHISYEHDVIVFCEGLCGACIHVSCYGVLYNGVPEGDFYCEGCTFTMGIANTTSSNIPRADKRKAKKEAHRRSSKATCALCFRSGGLMTLSTTDTFVHPICVLFTPELTFCPETARANNLSSLDKDRKYIKCEVCQEIGGAVVQCAETCCLKAAHPYCAYEARRQMVVRVHNAEDSTMSTQAHQTAGRGYTQQHTQNIHHKHSHEDSVGGQYNTYELYCTKHRSLPGTQKQKDSIIATSRLPLREPSTTSDLVKSVKNGKNTHNAGQDKKHKNQHHNRRSSIGIADQDTYSSDDSTNNDARTATKKRKGVQFVVKKGGARERDRGKSNSSSPGDLVDTAEKKPPRDLKKKRYVYLLG